MSGTVKIKTYIESWLRRGGASCKFDAVFALGFGLDVCFVIVRSPSSAIGPPFGLLKRVLWGVDFVWNKRGVEEV